MLSITGWPSAFLCYYGYLHYSCAVLYLKVFRVNVITVLISFIWRRLTFLSCNSFVAASEIPSTPPMNVREHITNFCINILLSYRKFCATVSSSGQLILPEALKLLPLYTLGKYFLHIDLCWLIECFCSNYRYFNALALSCYITVS